MKAATPAASSARLPSVLLRSVRLRMICFLGAGLNSD